MAKELHEMEEEPQGDYHDSGLEIAPDELLGKSGSEPEIIRWVSRNIDCPNPDPSDCPDPFAWTLLRQCRESGRFMGFFVEKLWAKLLPSRASQENADGDGKLDGSVTLDVIARVLAASEKARSETPRDGADG